MIDYSNPNMMRDNIAQALMQRQAPPNLSATPTPSPGGMQPPMPGPAGGIPAAALGSGASAPGLGSGGGGMPPAALGSGAAPNMLGQPPMPSMPPPPALQGGMPPPAGPAAGSTGVGNGPAGINSPQPGGSPSPMMPGKPFVPQSGSSPSGIDPTILEQLTGMRT